MRFSPISVALVSFTTFTVLSSTALGVQEAREPVVISVGVPLSGEWGAEGRAILNAVELATEEINGGGGLLGRKLLLAINDTEAAPLVAAELARNWSEQGTILAHIGGFASAPTIAAQRYFDTEGLLQLSPTVGHPAFAAGSPWSFSVVGVQQGEGESNARFAYHTLGVRKVAMLYRQDAWGLRMAEEFETEFSRLGGELVAREYYFETNPRFPEILDRIRKNDPELVYFVSKEGEGLEICRFLGEGSWERVRFLAPSKLHSPLFLGEAGKSAEGLYVSALFAPQNGEPGAQLFYREYLARYGEEPSPSAALAYDTTKILAAAVERARSLERRDVRIALAETDDFPGVTGRIRFSPDGNAIREYAHLMVKEGSFAAHE